MRCVVFPGKEFMISKYQQSKEQRAKIKDQRREEKHISISLHQHLKILVVVVSV